MKACVYILESESGRYYIGATRNLETRLRQHKSGTTRFTKRFKDLKPVLVYECESFSTARKIEQRLKSLKRKDYIKKIIKDGFIKIAIAGK